MRCPHLYTSISKDFITVFLSVLFWTKCIHMLNNSEKSYKFTLLFQMDTNSKAKTRLFYPHELPGFFCYPVSPSAHLTAHKQRYP